MTGLLGLLVLTTVNNFTALTHQHRTASLLPYTFFAGSPIEASGTTAGTTGANRLRMHQKGLKKTVDMEGVTCAWEGLYNIHVGGLTVLHWCELLGEMFILLLQWDCLITSGQIPACVGMSEYPRTQAACRYWADQCEPARLTSAVYSPACARERDCQL